MWFSALICLIIYSLKFQQHWSKARNYFWKSIKVLTPHRTRFSNIVKYYHKTTDLVHTATRGLLYLILIKLLKINVLVLISFYWFFVTKSSFISLSEIYKILGEEIRDCPSLKKLNLYVRLIADILNLLFYLRNNSKHMSILK